MKEIANIASIAKSVDWGFCERDKRSEMGIRMSLCYLHPVAFKSVTYIRKRQPGLTAAFFRRRSECAYEECNLKAKLLLSEEGTKRYSARRKMAKEWNGNAQGE